MTDPVISDQLTQGVKDAQARFDAGMGADGDASPYPMLAELWAQAPVHPGWPEMTKAAIDAYGELCDEGCLAIFGPNIGDNIIAAREPIEECFRVPSISVTGSDVALGEWVFSFPMGSR